MKITYQLRPANIEDKQFMMYLEKIICAQYPEIVERWDEEYQKNHYEHHFRPKYVSIIQYNENPIGAVSIVSRRKDISIVYIYLLPEFQDKEIDISLLKLVLKRAKKEHKAVMKCIFKGDNRAKKMYTQFGFELFAEDDLRWHVKWIPS
jgi:ribosomal protein S18 acetylase RimI-like enzyme